MITFPDETALSCQFVCVTGTSTGPLSVGCLAGDAQSYILFCDFFDRVIEAYHSYRVLGHVTQRSDFNYDNLKVSVSYITLFVPVYVILYHSAVAFSNHKVFCFFLQQTLPDLYQSIHRHLYVN